MNTSFIFDFKLAVPIVVEPKVGYNPIKLIEERLNISHDDMDDILHSRKSCRFYDSEESDRNVVSYCITKRQVFNFNSFEIMDISEYYNDIKKYDKKSKVLHGSKAVKCLAILAHLDLNMIESVQIPLDLYFECNHRQWVDISELVVKVLSRSNRLEKLIECGAPEIILLNEERVLQENVTFLECNDSLLRNDETTIRSLNDMDYSLVNGWLKDPEESDAELDYEVEESGDSDDT